MPANRQKFETIINLETIEAQVGLDLEPQTYNLRLANPGEADTLRSKWLNQFD